MLLAVSMQASTSHTRPVRRRVLLLGVFLLGGAAVGASVYVGSRTLPKRFAVVEEGVLYRSSQPSIMQIRNMKDKFDLRTVLIVRAGDSSRVPDEIEEARRMGLNVVHIEIDGRREITDEEVRQFFDCVDDPRNQPVLIHCSAGRHRTGYLCALYRIERQGWPADKALEEMRSYGGFDEDPPHVIEQQLRSYGSRSLATR